MDLFNKKNTELEAKVADLKEQVRVLQEAVHKLVAIEIHSRCPQSDHGGSRGGDPMPALIPFVTYHDPMGSGKVTKLGLGDIQ